MMNLENSKVKTIRISLSFRWKILVAKKVIILKKESQADFRVNYRVMNNSGVLKYYFLIFR